MVQVDGGGAENPPRVGPLDAAGRKRLDGDIWQMAWPVMLSLLLTNAVELIDVAMVGRLGRNSVAAVGYSTQYNHLLYTLLLSVGIGCVALMSRAIGARDRRRARSAFAGSVMVGLVLAVLGVGAVWVMPRQLLALLNAEVAVIDLSVPYFRLVISANLLVAISVMFESAFRAEKNMRAPMFVAFVTLVIKTLLNLLLMFGLFGMPRLELVGAGIATLLSYTVAFGLYVALARRYWDEGRGLGLGALFERGSETIGDVLRVSLPTILERLVMNVAIIAYFAILSGYGTAAIAAYTIGVRLLAFSWIPGTGFGAAAATLVGQALGARDAAGARRAGWRSVAFALGSMAVLGLICVLSREELARIFTSDEGIIEHLLIFMFMLAIAQPFMGVHFTLGGALRGAGAPANPLVAATVGNWVFRVPLAVLFAYVLEWPVIWVWAALIGDHVVRAIWLTSAFHFGRWSRRLGASLGAG